jgi:hypothetical protein
VHYNDLITDPVGTVTRISQHFGLPVDDETRRRAGDFTDENPQGKHGAHEYTPEQFGFEPERVRRRFAAYAERFGIEPDRPRPIPTPTTPTASTATSDTPVGETR